MTLAPLKVPGLERLDPLHGLREQQREVEEFERRRGTIAAPAPVTPQPATPAVGGDVSARRTGTISSRLASPSALAAGSTAAAPTSPALPAPTEEAPQPQTYKPEVERWRGDVSRIFAEEGVPQDLVDKALYVIEGESGGNPRAANPTSSARGLVQMMDLHGYSEEQRYDPQFAIRWMAQRIKQRGFADWGEGVLHEGKPFGILGERPYGGPRTAGREDLDSFESPQTFNAGRSTVSGRKFGSRLLELYEPDEALRGRIAPYINALAPDLAEQYLASYRATKRSVSPNAALQELYRSLQVEALADLMTPFLKERRPGATTTHDQDLTAARALIEKTGSFEAATKALNIQKETLESPNTFGAIFLQAALGAGLGAAFAPLKGAQAAGRAGTIARILGPQGAGPGRFALENLVQEAAAQAVANEVGKVTDNPYARLAAGFAGSAAATKGLNVGLGRRGMITRGPVASIVEDGAETTKPLPGQRGIFGDVVDEQGNIVPSAQTGAEAPIARVDLPDQRTPQQMPTGQEGAQTAMFGGPAPAIQPGFGTAEPPPPARPTTSRFDTPEIVALRARQNELPPTSTIDTPERQAFRQEVQDKLYGSGAANKERRADIVLGPPAAGKSSRLADPLRTGYGELQIDADAAKELIPEFEGGSMAGRVHQESSDIADAIVARAMEAGDNLNLPLVGKNPNRIAEIINNLDQAGYKVYLHLVELPAEKAAARAVSRHIETGRFVDPLYVESIGDSPMRTYDKIKAEAKLSGFSRWNNDVDRGKPPALLEYSGADALPPGFDTAAAGDTGLRGRDGIGDGSSNGPSTGANPPAPGAAAADTAPGVTRPEEQVIARLPDVNGIQRDRRVISTADIEAKPAVFQARDVAAGQAVDETRVNQIVRAWDDALFIPPNVVRDPETGKWIVYAGHHRVEAWRRVKGPDAPIEVVASHADIRDPDQLRALQLEADASNFTTATPNFRENIRAIQRGVSMGESVEDIAGRLRMTASKVDAALDAARVGEAAVDRVVKEKGLEPYLAEIGRGMRLHGMTLEEANGFFNQIADAKKGQRPTVAAVRQTIDEELAAWRELQGQQAQQAMFGADEGKLAGTEAGFMGFMNDIARTRGELDGAITAIRKAQNQAEKLGAIGGTASAREAAQRLVNIGKAEERRIRQLLELQQVNIRRLARGEAPLPAPGTADAPTTSAPRVAGGQPPAAPPDGPASPPGGRPAPDPERLPNAVTQLVAYTEAAGAMRPDLLERRRLELRTRVARAAEALHAEGVDPAEAFANARKELRGQLADPAFEMPGSLDADVLHREIVDAVDRRDVQFFTGNAADRGLQKLKMGQIPAPAEVEALGQVFGPRLQYAIEGLGDIFKVQRRIEAVVDRVDVEIKFPDGGVLTPDDLADAMAAHIPNADPDTLRKASERLIDQGKVGVAIDPKTGKTTARVSKNSEVDALGEAAYRAMFDEDVPGQELPPTQSAAEEFQPSLALATKNEGPPAPIGDSPDAVPWSGMPRADRPVQPIYDNPNADPLRMEAQPTAARMESAPGPNAYAPAPNAPLSPEMQAQVDQLKADALARTGKVQGDDWDPNVETLTARTFGTLRNIVGLPRSLMATMDRSGYLRQGGLLIRHGEQVMDGIAATMVIAEDAADAARMRQRLGLPDDWEIPNAEDVMGALHNDRWAKVRKAAGVYEEAWGKDAKLGERNEQFMSDLAAKIIPGAKMSNRAHVVYLNKLRGDVFNSVLDKWVRESTKFGNKELEALARYVNAATGRGNLRDFEGAAAALATAFFAPRYLVSRFEVLGQLVGPSTPYLVRKEIAKDLAVFVGTGVSLLSIAKLSGLAEVEDDPRSSDFGKMKIGNTRLDMFAGYTQIARLTAQLMTGQAKSGAGNIYDVNREDVAWRFLRSKLAPTVGFGINAVAERDMAGQKFDPTDPTKLLQMVTPLFLQDLYKSIDEQGATGLLYFPAGFFGFGVQTYSSPSEELREARNAESNRRFGVDYEDLPDRYPDSGFTKQTQVDGIDDVAKKREAAREASRESAFGQEQRAREESKAEFTARREQAEKAFKDGTLSKPIPEVWSDISKEEAGSRRAFELAYGTKDFNKTTFDNALNGYYDKTVYGADGLVDWEQTILAQETYLARLPSKERQQVEDFLGVQDRKKSQLWQDYRAFVDAKEKAGYYREGITNAERQKLDRENPELDAQGWYYRGGVKPDKGPNPSLQSRAAVDNALQLLDEKGIKNRQVKLSGLDRAINADEGTLAAWQTYSARIDNFLNKAIVTYGDREATRLYKKRFAELTNQQQSTVIAQIHSGLRENSPELDAALAWFGYGADQDKSYALRSRAAGKALQAIKARFGEAAPREGYRYRYAKDAR